MFAFLLDNGADVNANHCDTKRTPLVEATIRGDEKMVERLVSEGADVNIEDREGMTPLHWASHRGT